MFVSFYRIPASCLNAVHPHLSVEAAGSNTFALGMSNIDVLLLKSLDPVNKREFKRSKAEQTHLQPTLWPILRRGKDI